MLRVTVFTIGILVSLLGALVLVGMWRDPPSGIVMILMAGLVLMTVSVNSQSPHSFSVRRKPDIRPSRARHLFMIGLWVFGGCLITFGLFAAIVAWLEARSFKQVFLDGGLSVLAAGLYAVSFGLVVRSSNSQHSALQSKQTEESYVVQDPDE